MKELIDDLDLKIIKLLEQNGRIPNTELAKKLVHPNPLSEIGLNVLLKVILLK